jgi:hypothetical protein
VPVISGGSGGGGAGFTPVTVMVQNAASVDAHAAGTYAFKPGAIFDNPFAQTPLVAIPAGLGISFPFDSSSATLTTTSAGVWAFTYTVFLHADASFVGSLNFIGLDSISQHIAPPAGAGGDGVVLTDVLAIPTGATGSFAITTTTGATANPYNVDFQLEIVRLA